MKTRIILFLLLCVSCTTFAQKINVNVPGGQIAIDGHWKGDDFGDDKSHRSIPYLPIIAMLGEDVITLDFQEAADDVTVTISNESQTVLSRSLSVVNPGSYSIPVDACAPGVYLLELTNSYGGYVYGWFELK